MNDNVPRFHPSRPVGVHRYLGDERKEAAGQVVAKHPPRLAITSPRPVRRMIHNRAGPGVVRPSVVTVGRIAPISLQVRDDLRRGYRRQDAEQRHPQDTLPGGPRAEI